MESKSFYPPPLVPLSHPVKNLEQPRGKLKESPLLPSSLWSDTFRAADIPSRGKCLSRKVKPQYRLGTQPRLLTWET